MGGIVDSIFGGPPQAPDPYATANAQGAMNLDTLYASAGLNQINQLGPGYNISWSGDIGDPNRTMTYSLDPAREELANLLGYSTLNQAGMIGGPIDYSGVRGIPGGDYGEYTNQLIGDKYTQLMDLMRPDLDRQRASRTTDLAVRGLPVGQEAYEDVMQSLARTEQDAMTRAATESIGLGINEASRLFGQDMAAHQQGMADIGFDQNMALQNLAMMLNANPYNTTQIQNPAQYQASPPDLAGLVQGNYANQMGAYGSNMGALGQIGGMAAMGAMMSDIRMKENIEKIGELPSGIGVYRFNYLSDDAPQIGVMAQDVEKIIPDAVHEYMGVKFVDYSKVM